MDDQVRGEGAEDVGAGAGEDGAEIRVGGDGAAQDAGDDGGGGGIEQRGEFVADQATRSGRCAEAHPTGGRKRQREAEAPALAVGEVARGEEIAVGFGEADAREMREGGFDGDVGEVVDDGFARERDAGDVGGGEFAAAAEAAEEGGFAGAGGAGEEEDLAGDEGRESGEWEGGKFGRGFEAEPFADQGAVGLGRCADGRRGRLRGVNFVNPGRWLSAVSWVCCADYEFAAHSHSPCWCCAIGSVVELEMALIALAWSSSWRVRRSQR